MVAARKRLRISRNQTEIGDYIGLTNVYVSRSLLAMEDEGMIERGENVLTVMKEAEMARLCDFQNRYAKIDTSWFPQ